ncbi:hypothetical protein [Tychonema sp. LEGE 07203]|nr:hypothetical protein [Tychonema sp. LEGE 07203]
MGNSTSAQLLAIVHQISKKLPSSSCAFPQAELRNTNDKYSR